MSTNQLAAGLARKKSRAPVVTPKDRVSELRDVASAAKGTTVATASPQIQGLAGFVAGFVSAIVTHPLDLVKTRFQSSHFNHYKSIANATRSIVRTEGGKALYNGLGASLCGTSVAWGSYFLVYAQLKENIRDGSDRKLVSSEHWSASFRAGAVVQVLTTPFWVVKTNCVLNANGNMMDNARRIYETRGPIGFYRGLLPSMFGVFQASLFFTVYEQTKYLIQDYRGDTQLGPLDTVVNTIWSKSVATVVTYPYQIVRTRLQHVHVEKTNVSATAQVSALSRLMTVVGTQPQSVKIIRNVRRHDGWRGFYRGLSVNLIRILPSTCITFLVYEFLIEKSGL